MVEAASNIVIVVLDGLCPSNSKPSTISPTPKVKSPWIWNFSKPLVLAIVTAKGILFTGLSTLPFGSAALPSVSYGLSTST